MYARTVLPSFLLVASAVALPWGPSHGKPACSDAVAALAAGIHLNIVGQYGEYNSTLNVINVEAQYPAMSTEFYIAKGELMEIIQAGENIRLFNQEIAPAGNAAIPGLAEYEAAQQTEQALAAGLTGVQSEDAASLDSLKSDIMAGIKLNEANLAAAIKGCKLEVTFPNPDQAGT